MSKKRIVRLSGYGLILIGFILYIWDLLVLFLGALIFNTDTWEFTFYWFLNYCCKIDYYKIYVFVFIPYFILFFIYLRYFRRDALKKIYWIYFAFGILYWLIILFLSSLSTGSLFGSLKLI